jgi:hypothetical protein
VYDKFFGAPGKPGTGAAPGAAAGAAPGAPAAFYFCCRKIYVQKIYFFLGSQSDTKSVVKL